MACVASYCNPDWRPIYKYKFKKVIQKAILTVAWLKNAEEAILTVAWLKNADQPSRKF
jgi:hypothetical protein